MIDVATYPTICDRTDGASRKNRSPSSGQALVRQVEPGTRLRIALCRNMEVPIPDAEPLIHAAFDLVSASGGGVL